MNRTVVILFWYFAFKIERVEAAWDSDKESHRRYQLVVEQLCQKESFEEI